MKHFYSAIVILIFTVCSTSPVAAYQPSAHRDTINRYVIDSKLVEHFDGSQLVGKKISSYNISTSLSGKHIIRLHNISTEGTSKKSSPACVVDGKQITQEEYKKLDPTRIKNISVIKKVTDEALKKYVGWENGVILIETHKDGTVNPSVEGANINKTVTATGSPK